MSSKHSYTLVLKALLRQAAYDPVKGEISAHVLDAYINAGDIREIWSPSPSPSARHDYTES